MKTLDEIINRQDYARVNNALMKRAPEIARIIRDKMEYLGLDSLEEFRLDLCRVRHGANRALCTREVVSYDVTWYNDLCGEVDVFSYSHLYKARPCDCLYLLTHAREIFEYLDNYESEYVAKVEKALAETSNIK